jgi:hypothetical protein
MHLKEIDEDGNPLALVYEIRMNRNLMAKYVAAHHLSRTDPKFSSNLHTLSEESWLNMWVQACHVLRGRPCHLDVDKVNATIGIARPSPPRTVPMQLFEGIPRTARDIFVWMSSFLLQNAPNLVQLSYGRSPSSEKLKELPTKGLPTWATDFAVNQDNCPVIWRHALTLAWHEEKGRANSQSFDGEILSMSGVIVDKLKDLPVLGNSAIAECFLHYAREISMMEPLYKSTKQSVVEAM